MHAPSIREIKEAIDDYIDTLSQPLHELNQKACRNLEGPQTQNNQAESISLIHSTPELAYNEHVAHDTICKFLESEGIPTTRHAYGLATAFEALAGSEGGRCVNFNAEYDALPEIGHACGHNLIATASVTGFVALAYAIRRFKLPGQAQLLGTPAEEDGGGKIDLIQAGAFRKPDVSLMIHPMSEVEFDGVHMGVAGRSSIACYDVTATFHGTSAHASASPWEGVNALDALVASYNNISMLRQQIKPDDRIHGAILQAPTITNAIPETTRTKYTIRSRTMNEARELGDRVRACLNAGALATGCEVKLEESQIFADLVVNKPLSASFKRSMSEQGEQIMDADETLMPGSTDQGNVSQTIPSLHALVGIPVSDNAKNHTRQFNTASATEIAHQRMICAGKAMAMTGVKLILNDGLYSSVHEAFERTMRTVTRA